MYSLFLAARLGPVELWVVNVAIASWLVLMCLKTIGHGYFTAVRWHNLKVAAHNLRIRQQREVIEVKRDHVLAEGVRMGVGNPTDGVADFAAEIPEAESVAQAA